MNLPRKHLPTRDTFSAARTRAEHMRGSRGGDKIRSYKDKHERCPYPSSRLSAGYCISWTAKGHSAKVSRFFFLLLPLLKLLLVRLAFSKRGHVSHEETDSCIPSFQMSFSPRRCPASLSPEMPPKRIFGRTVLYLWAMKCQALQLPTTPFASYCEACPYL